MARLHQSWFGDGGPGSEHNRQLVPGDSPTAVPKVRALEFIHPMRGASQPHLVRCEDGENYVVKFQTNLQHVRIPANEMLASRLALLIGLPVPAPAFVEVTPELIARDSFPETDSRAKQRAPGIQFGSRFPGSPSRTLVVDFLPDRLLRRVRDLGDVFSGRLLV